MKITFLAVFVTLLSIINATSIKPIPPPIITKPCILPCPMSLVNQICAGPVIGCGELMSFGNLCLMDNYNCQNPGNQYEQKYNTSCYPNEASPPGAASEKSPSLIDSKYIGGKWL